MTPEDIAMFEMFDRKGWDSDRRRAYLRELLRREADLDLAAE